MNIIDYVILFCSIAVFIMLIVLCFNQKKQQSEYYKAHEPKLIKIKENLQKLVPYLSQEERYKLRLLKIQPDVSSYTVDKHDMHLCLLDQDGSYYQDNLLMYATLHELAHIFCDDIGHTPAYRKIFDRLLKLAKKVNIYDDTKLMPQEYCGVKI